jgi:hypothetical protein
VGGIPLDRLDEVRDQIVSAFKLDADIRPGFLGLISKRDEPVI